MPSGTVVDLLQDYLRLYQLCNQSQGNLEPEVHGEWKELAFTIDRIFSGGYQPGLDDTNPIIAEVSNLREAVSLGSLRIPVERSALCDDEQTLFAGTVRNLSQGGLYLEAKLPLDEERGVRVNFRTFENDAPISVEGRVVWTNYGSMRRHDLPTGVGIQFVESSDTLQRNITNYIYDLVTQRLVQANLIFHASPEGPITGAGRGS